LALAFSFSFAAAAGSASVTFNLKADLKKVESDGLIIDITKISVPFSFFFMGEKKELANQLKAIPTPIRSFKVNKDIISKIKAQGHSSNPILNGLGTNISFSEVTMADEIKDIKGTYHSDKSFSDILFWLKREAKKFELTDGYVSRIMNTEITIYSSGIKNVNCWKDGILTAFNQARFNSSKIKKVIRNFKSAKFSDIKEDDKIKKIVGQCFKDGSYEISEFNVLDKSLPDNYCRGKDKTREDCGDIRSWSCVNNQCQKARCGDGVCNDDGFSPAAEEALGCPQDCGGSSAGGNGNNGSGSNGDNSGDNNGSSHESKPYCYKPLENKDWTYKTSYIGNSVNFSQGWFLKAKGAGTGLIYKSDDGWDIDAQTLFGNNSHYGCAGKVEIIWHYDFNAEKWTSFVPDEMGFTNLKTIKNGEIYSINMKEPCALKHPNKGSFWKSEYCENGCENGMCKFGADNNNGNGSANDCVNATNCGGNSQWSCVNGQCQAAKCGDGVCNDCRGEFSPCVPSETSENCSQDCKEKTVKQDNRDYSTKGYTIGYKAFWNMDESNKDQGIDYCTTIKDGSVGSHKVNAGPYLVEFYKDDQGFAAFEVVKCENGCKDGACLSN